MDCTSGIQVERPSGTKSCMLLCSMPLPRSRFSMWPMELRSGSCKAPRSVLETPSTSSRRPALPVDFPPAIQGPALQPRSFLCRYLRACPSASPCSECAQNEPILFKPFLASILSLLDSLSAQICSAFCTMRSASACDERPFSLTMVIRWTACGAGGIPSNQNFAEKVAILGQRHSPSKTG